MSVHQSLKLTFQRSRMLIAAISAAFFSTMIIAGVVTYVILTASPNLFGSLQAWLQSQSAAGYIAIPPPYTEGLYKLIFLNNIGHFWNPVRLWVWIPLVGAFELGYELLLNGIVIGCVASFVSLTKGPMYTAAGLLPHGVIEIPAFILEFVGLARWHVTTTRVLYAKFSGRPIDRPMFREGILDTVILSLISVSMFAIAAYVETFITPRFLGR